MSKQPELKKYINEIYSTHIKNDFPQKELKPIKY
jgi:hypothetical protein